MHQRSDAQALKKCFHHPVLFFPSRLLSLRMSLPINNFRQIFLFHQLVTIGHDSLFHLAVPLRCMKPSSSVITSATVILNNGGMVGWDLAGTAGVCARYQSEGLVVDGGYR